MPGLDLEKGIGVYPHVISGTTPWRPRRVAAVIGGRRRYRRWRLNLPIRELRPEGHLMRASSLSAGGLFCPDVPPRELGSEIVLEIDLLDGFGTIIAQGRVVYAGTSSAGLGIGVAFSAPQLGLASFLMRAAGSKNPPL